MLHAVPLNGFKFGCEFYFRKLWIGNASIYNKFLIRNIQNGAQYSRQSSQLNGNVKMQ